MIDAVTGSERRALGKLVMLGLTDGRFGVVLVLAALSGGLALYVLRGDEAHLMVAVGAFLLAFVLLFASLFVVGIGESRDRARADLWKARGAVVASTSLVAFTVTLSFLPGMRIRERDVRSAQSFTETLAPRLEAFRRQHGHYPLALEEVLTDAQDVPRLFGEAGIEDSGRARYTSSGEDDAARYEIVLAEPLVPDWVYNSDSQRWSRR